MLATVQEKKNVGDDGTRGHAAVTAADESPKCNEIK